MSFTSMLYRLARRAPPGWSITRRGHLRPIAAAAVLAVLVIGFVVYRNHRQRTSVGGGPVVVLVAKTQIQKGTPGRVIAETGLYKVSALRQSEVETGAIVDPSTLNGEVAAKDIYPGQQLTAAEFAPAAPTGPNERAHQPPQALPKPVRPQRQHQRRHGPSCSCACLASRPVASPNGTTLAPRNRLVVARRVGRVAVCRATTG